jgi:phosphomethylpyrimidine kinase
MKQVLTIAGSDSGGGAGIQADIKAMSANGVFAMSVITAVTAQNTEEVTDVFELPASIIEAQIDAVFDDFEVAAVKTGMLSSAAIITTVARMLRPQNIVNLVVDPVMASKSGHPLLKFDAMDALKRELIPMALVITPNVPEAEQLSGLPIKSLADARQAAKVIHKLGCKNVLIKGGHLMTDRATDVLYDGKFFNIFKGEFIDYPPHARHRLYVCLSHCRAIGKRQSAARCGAHGKGLPHGSDPAQLGHRPWQRPYQPLLLPTRMT